MIENRIDLDHFERADFPARRKHLHNEVRFAKTQAALDRRPGSRRLARVDAVHIERDVNRSGDAGDCNRFLHDAGDAEPIDVGHRKRTHPRLTQIFLFDRIDIA